MAHPITSPAFRFTHRQTAPQNKRYPPIRKKPSPNSNASTQHKSPVPNRSSPRIFCAEVLRCRLYEHLDGFGCAPGYCIPFGQFVQGDAEHLAQRNQFVQLRHAGSGFPFGNRLAGYVQFFRKLPLGQFALIAQREDFSPNVMVLLPFPRFYHSKEEKKCRPSERFSFSNQRLQKRFSACETAAVIDRKRKRCYNEHCSV